jgi:hypothetical protein
VITTKRRRRASTILLILQLLWLAGCGTTILNARFEGEQPGPPDTTPNGDPVDDQLQVIDHWPSSPIVLNSGGGAAGITTPSLFMRPVESSEDENAAIRFKTTKDYDPSRKRTISWQGRWYVGDHFECRVGGMYGSQFRYGPTVRFKAGKAQTFAGSTWHDIAPIELGEVHSVRIRYYPDNTFYVAVTQPNTAEGRFPAQGLASVTPYSIPAIEQTERLMLHCQFVSTKVAGSTEYRYVIDDVRVKQDKG